MKIFKSLLLISALTTVSITAQEVLAVVNGSPVKKSDIDFVLQATGKKFDTMTSEEQKQLIDKFIDREIIVNIAKKDNIDKSEEYKQALENCKKDLLIKLWMDKVFEHAIISDSEANKFYQEHKEDMFKKPAMAKARHILVKKKEDAEKIIEKLKGLKGEELKKKFIELAKSKSIGPSAKFGGDLGEFPRGEMVKPFDNAVFKLEKGQITQEPVETEFGFHIIYLEDKSPESILPFKEVKKIIIDKRRDTEFQKVIDETIAKEKKNSKIEVNFKINDKNNTK